MSHRKLSEGEARRQQLRLLEFERVMIDLEMMTASNEEEVEFIKYKRTQLDEQIDNLRKELQSREAEEKEEETTKFN